MEGEILNSAVEIDAKISPVEFEEFIDTFIQPAGRWQWSVFLVLLIPMSSPYVIIPTITHIIPPHRCRLSSPLKSNLSYAEVTNLTIPWKLNAKLPPMVGQLYHPCRQFRDWNYSINTYWESKINIHFDGNNTEANVEETEECTDGMTFDNSSSREFSGTVVEEFELVCSRSYLGPSSVSIFMWGEVIASCITGYLADKYGRRTVVLSCGFAQLIGGFAIAIVPNIFMYILVQFVIGFSTIGILVTGVVYLSEITDARHRNLFVILSILAYDFLSAFVLTAIGYWLQNWRYINAIISLMNIPILFFNWTIHESPRWLLANGKQREAFRILKKGYEINHPKRVFDEAKFAHLELPQNDLDRPSPYQRSIWKRSKQTLSSFFVLFTFPAIRMRSLLICILWFVTGFLYYGYMFNSVKLGGNVYIVLASMGIVAIPANVTRYILLERLGRQRLIALVFIASLPILAAIAVIQISFKNYEESKSLGFAVIGLAIFGKFGIDIVFSALFTYTPELYPTEVRNYGVGMASAFARIGSTLAPFVVLLGDTLWRPSPMLCFVGVQLLGVAAILPLPETKGMPMIDKLIELNLSENNKKQTNKMSVNINDCSETKEIDS